MSQHNYKVGDRVLVLPGVKVPGLEDRETPHGPATGRITRVRGSGGRPVFDVAPDAPDADSPTFSFHPEHIVAYPDDAPAYAAPRASWSSVPAPKLAPRIPAGWRRVSPSDYPGISRADFAAIGGRCVDQRTGEVERLDLSSNPEGRLLPESVYVVPSNDALPEGYRLIGPEHLSLTREQFADLGGKYRCGARACSLALAIDPDQTLREAASGNTSSTYLLPVEEVPVPPIECHSTAYKLPDPPLGYICQLNTPPASRYNLDNTIVFTGGEWVGASVEALKRGCPIAIRDFDARRGACHTHTPGTRPVPAWPNLPPGARILGFGTPDGLFPKGVPAGSALYAWAPGVHRNGWDKVAGVDMACGLVEWHVYALVDALAAPMLPAGTLVRFNGVLGVVQRWPNRQRHHACFELVRFFRRVAGRPDDISSTLVGGCRVVRREALTIEQPPKPFSGGTHKSACLGHKVGTLVRVDANKKPVVGVLLGAAPEGAEVVVPKLGVVRGALFSIQPRDFDRPKPEVGDLVYITTTGLYGRVLEVGPMILTVKTRNSKSMTRRAHKECVVITKAWRAKSYRLIPAGYRAVTDAELDLTRAQFAKLGGRYVNGRGEARPLTVVHAGDVVLRDRLAYRLSRGMDPIQYVMPLSSPAAPARPTPQAAPPQAAPPQAAPLGVIGTYFRDMASRPIPAGWRLVNAPELALTRAQFAARGGRFFINGAPEELDLSGHFLKPNQTLLDAISQNLSYASCYVMPADDRRTESNVAFRRDVAVKRYYATMTKRTLPPGWRLVTQSELELTRGRFSELGGSTLSVCGELRKLEPNIGGYTPETTLLSAISGPGSRPACYVLPATPDPVGSLVAPGGGLLVPSFHIPEGHVACGGAVLTSLVGVGKLPTDLKVWVPDTGMWMFPSSVSAQKVPSPRIYCYRVTGGAK